MLVPKYVYSNSSWPTTSTYNQFYKMDENSVDVLFLGSSVVVNAFSPQELYNKYGIRSYNLGSEQQSLFLSYYWLKEALRTQSPKAVILDTIFLYKLHPNEPINTVEGLTRKCLDPMHLSPVKIEAVSELCRLDESQDKLSYYFKNLRFHSSWTTLKESDIMLNLSMDAPLKGHSALSEYSPLNYAGVLLSDDTTEKEPDDIMLEYLDKTVSLCKENGISLILTSLPGNFMDDGINNYITNYSKLNQIDYYNLCEVSMYEQLDAKLPRENTLNHANVWGSIILTDYFGKILSEKYEIFSTKDSQYESTKDFNDAIKAGCELPHIDNLTSYEKALKSGDYTVLYAMNNMDTLESKENFYCAISTKKDGLKEYSEKSPISVTGSIREGWNVYSISSTGYMSAATCSISIDGVEYAIKQPGMNIVVYDNYLQKVIDSACFNEAGMRL